MSFAKDFDDPNQKKRKAEGMSWQDRTSLWFEKTSFKEAPEEPPQSAAGGGEAPERKFPDGDEELEESRPTTYMKSLTNSSAYQELLAFLRREFHLVPAELNIMEEIRDEIMSSLPSPDEVIRNISSGTYHATPGTCHATFRVDWDIIGFFKTQGYLEEPNDVFEEVITITGSCQDAQAATCAQYIKQTWPIIGETVIQLIRAVLMEEGHTLQRECSTFFIVVVLITNFI
jgi:hypothetical protein